MKKFIFLLYLTAVFSLPVWKRGYKQSKYRFSNSMPAWMLKAIQVKNQYEADYELLDAFYWFRAGDFYIRKLHSFPDAGLFYFSESHLFVWHKKRRHSVETPA